MRKTLLYASRLKGDLDLGREPTRVINSQKRYAQLLSDGGLLAGGQVQGALEESVTQNYRIGTKLREEGIDYYYSLSGGVNLDVAKLMQGEVPVADMENMVPTASYAIGVSVIEVTLGATPVTLNEYADGWLFVNAGTGKGQKLKIMSHPVAAGAATCVFTCWEALTIAFDGTTRVTLVKNPYQDLIVHPSPPTSLVVGVPQFTVTALRYFWLLGRGPTALLTDGTLYQHRQVTPSASVDGAVKHAIQEIAVSAEIAIGTKMAKIADSAGADSVGAITGTDAAYGSSTIDIGHLQNIVGEVMVLRATTEYSMIMLKLGK